MRVGAIVRQSARLGYVRGAGGIVGQSARLSCAWAGAFVGLSAQLGLCAWAGGMVGLSTRLGLCAWAVAIVRLPAQLGLCACGGRDHRTICEAAVRVGGRNRTTLVRLGQRRTGCAAQVTCTGRAGS